MNVVDTNILFYAHDPRDPEKQQTAQSLIESLLDGALLWQVACEYLSASRKLEPFGYSREQALQEVRDLRSAWVTILPSWQVLEWSQQLLKEHSVSFWDAMILAASREAGVSRLYSEDLDPRIKIDELEIINPFTK
jgi:predicted nucleic acid-binding protein